MRPAPDNTTLKKATNLSINKELLAEARSLNINLSATLELALAEKIRQERRRLWIENNRDAIDACNELTERHGLFSDKHRLF